MCGIIGLFAVLALQAPGTGPASCVRGVTVSCQTFGREWGTDGFGDTLDQLTGLGANWVAIHPYAGIGADGTVRSRLDPDDPPPWLLRPIEEAHARGMEILVKPHLAYWGSPFRWRGDIDFQGPARERFFASYREWILALASVTSAADAFVIGTELDRLTDDARPWRALVHELRGLTEAKLTYAANWDGYAAVPFWDALDAIGVQAYFPLATARGPAPLPEADQLRAAWRPVLAELRALHEHTGKPVIFTELGYDRSLQAASRPWSPGAARGPERGPAGELQRRCLLVALEVLEEERAWLRGAFLWKWFVGPAAGEDFLLDTPELRAELARAWKG